jgi:ribosomal protein S8
MKSNININTNINTNTTTNTNMRFIKNKDMKVKIQSNIAYIESNMEYMQSNTNRKLNMKEFCRLILILKNAIMAGKSFQIYKFLNKNICNIYLKILYEEGFILSYIYSDISNYYILYLNLYNNYNSLSLVKFFLKKKYPLYITYKDLCTYNNQNTGELFYLSTSKYGLIPHYQALKNKVGGKIICLIR